MCKKFLLQIIFVSLIVCQSTVFSQNKIEFSTSQKEISNVKQPAVLFNSSYNLPTLITFAESNNPELKSAHHKWQAAKERVSQAKSLPDPHIAYGYFMEEIQTRTGPQEHRFAVSQTIPWFEKLSLKEKIALKETEAVYQEYQQLRLRLIENIKSTFHEYGYLFHAIEINKQHIELLKAMEQVASIRVKSGTLPQTNLLQIQIEQSKIEERIKELETLRVPLSSKLYVLLGMEPSNVLPWPEPFQNEIIDLDETNLNTLIFENNPSLKRIEILTEMENYNKELANKNFYPDFTISLERINVDGGDDPMIAMFSINLPIWWEKLNAAKRETVELKESRASSYRNQKYQLSAEFDLALYHFQDAQRKLRLYMNTLIPKAQQAINIALKDFETDKISFADLLEVERSLLEFQLMGKRQLANSNIRFAEIERLIGIELPCVNQQNKKE
ncbi:TolC family protein [bacterium]|nr:TolC family protein [bacterium]MCP5462954.1 TolC family protein [bacterium]